MARYIYKSTRNYKEGFEWITVSFSNPDVRFRFILQGYRGLNLSGWMSSEQAVKYISHGGLFCGYFDSLRIIKRTKISNSLCV